MFNINWALVNGPINDQDGPVELDFDAINQFPYCFVFGDLNYRVEIETAEVMELLKNETQETIDQ
eukprot:Pgem_evm1s13380